MNIRLYKVFFNTLFSCRILKNKKKMSIILNKIKENYGTKNSFSSWDLHLITNINFKVIQMCLKKMHNKEILYSNQKYGIYQLKTDSEILKDKIKANELIDKYNLDNKKYKL